MSGPPGREVIPHRTAVEVNWETIVTRSLQINELRYSSIERTGINLMPRRSFNNFEIRRRSLAMATSTTLRTQTALRRIAEALRDFAKAARMEAR